MMACDFQIGPTAGTMIGAQTLFGTDPDYPNYRPPASPGADMVATLAGTETWRGYGRAVWHFDFVPDYKLASARAYALGSTTLYSAQCYIRTLDADGVYRDYRAIARFPNPLQFEHVGNVYQNVDIAFILLEVV